MSSTEMLNPRFSRFSGRPPQTPMGPRLRGPRSPISPETASNPRDSAITLSPLTVPADLLSPISEKSTQCPPSFPEPPAPTPKASPKRLMLPPPPTLNFDTVPVQWKSLPLEAALWTFNSRELQELVSRAIRLTARESFIRILSLENLDRALPTEVERLRDLKSSTQSKYRFLVYRRTMLLQALNSSADSTTNVSNNNIKDKDGDVVSQLVVQLAQTTAECDRVLEELLRICDQLSQIERMVDLHWASALAIALRKLNKSYARRTSDLLAARERIEQLEAELNDAWKEAERIAKEVDDFNFDTEEAVIETAEKIFLPTSPPPPPPKTAELLQVDPLPVFTPLSPVPLPSFAHTPTTEKEEDARSDLPTHTQLQTQPQLQNQPPPVLPKDTTDTASIRSSKSVRSIKSIHAKNLDGTPTTQLHLVASARKRSHRASKSSLRLTHMCSHSHSRSHSRTGTPHPYDEEEHPPVPDIPLEFSVVPPFPTSASPKPSSNIVWPGSSSTDNSHILSARPSHLRTHSRQLSASSWRYRKTSLDDITQPQSSRKIEKGRGRRDSSSSYTPTVTVDDIHVPPPSYHRYDEVQVPRTPTFVSTFTLPPIPVLRSLRRRLSSSRASVDPRNRLSVDVALDAVAGPLSPARSPTSLPLPPSPLSPSSFNTDVTERGRAAEREANGRDGENHLFSGSEIPSMWLHADSRSNMRDRERNHGWGRETTLSPPRGDGGLHKHEHEGAEDEADEHMDDIGHGIGSSFGRRNRSTSGIGYGNGNRMEMGLGNGNSRQTLRPYEKLKTLTKRYSLNFPLSMFVDRTRPGVSSGVGAGASRMAAAAASGGGAGSWRPTSHVSSPN